MQAHFICMPTALMYLNPDKKSEVTDELIYGTKVIIQEDIGEYVLVKTDYGYNGYIEKKSIAKNDKTFDGEKYIVTSNFCDLHSYPEYRFAPHFTLPRASVIYGEEYEANGRFIKTAHLGNTFFAPKNNLTKYSDISKFHDENSKRNQIVKTAFSYTGIPYRWGGKSSFGIDCSGLCFMVYYLCGMALYRDAVPDRRYVKPIAFYDLKPADLIYYNGHVTMYIGEGQYIHSSATLGGVKVGSFDEKDDNYYPTLATDIVTCARYIAFSD